jgi:SAM-dependent methyltransferase
MTKITKRQDQTIKGGTSNTTVASKPSMTREDWDTRYSGKEFLWTVEPNRTLTHELVKYAPGRALDLAAGEGRNAVWLAEQGWTVQAVDFSAVAIEKARQLAMGREVSSRIIFKVADLTWYEPEEYAFDLVTLIYLQIPFAQLVPIIKRAACAVAPGGVFLLVAHDFENLTQGYGGPQHADVLYTAEQVAAALDGDLEIVKACRLERPVAVEGRTLTALDCLVLARRLNRAQSGRSL